MVPVVALGANEKTKNPAQGAPGHTETGPMHITGSTRVFLILGDPVAQVRAPEVFNHLFRMHGADAVLVPAQVPVAHFEGFARTVLRAVDAAGRTLRGATVTARWNDTPWLPSFLLVEATRADGAFELGRLGRGSWEFRVSHPGVGTLTHHRTIGNEAAVTIVVAPQ